MQPASKATARPRRRVLPWLLIGAAVVALLGVVAVILWNYPDLDRFPVRGIDVSHHQGEIDWSRVGNAGVHFAFIKATEGGDFLDTRFEQNWQAAKEAGLVRGAYHFFTFCRDGVAQADHFLATLPPSEGTLPPGVDVEFAGNCRSWTTIEKIRAELQSFLDRLEAAWGRMPVLYVTSESAERIVNGHFDRYPVWIRSVFFRPGGREPEWLFWQYTDDGSVPGIDTPVDMNVYSGRHEDLAALIR